MPSKHTTPKNDGKDAMYGLDTPFDSTLLWQLVQEASAAAVQSGGTCVPVHIHKRKTSKRLTICGKGISLN
jgi:hypothetical protein